MRPMVSIRITTWSRMITLAGLAGKRPLEEGPLKSNCSESREQCFKAAYSWSGHTLHTHDIGNQHFATFWPLSALKDALLEKRLSRARMAFCTFQYLTCRSQRIASALLSCSAGTSLVSDPGNQLLFRLAMLPAEFTSKIAVIAQLQHVKF